MRFVYLAALLSCAAFAEQNVERVLTCSHCSTAQDVAEVATVLRSVLDIREVSTDPDGKTVTLRAAQGQLEAAEWLVKQIDRAPANPQISADLSKLEYRLAADDSVRVFFAPNAPGFQEFQESATVMRSIAEIRRVFTYNSPRAIVARGTDQQMTMAEWIHREFARAPNQTPAGQLQVGPDDNIRVFYLPNAPTLQDFQEMATVMRSTAEIRRLFTYSWPHAIVLRGTDEQLRMADWMYHEFTRAPNAAAAGELHISGGETLRVFYLPNTPSVSAFQKEVVEVRKTTGIRRVFTVNRPRAVYVRDTPDKVSQAATLFATM